VEDKRAFSTTTSEGLTIPAREKGTSTFLVVLAYADIIGIVSDYAKKDYLSTVVKTEIVIPLPDIPGLPPSLSFSYDLEKQIPAVKPRIAIANFRIKQPSSLEIAAALKEAGKAAAQQTVESLFRNLLSGSVSAPVPEVSLTDIDIPLTVSFDIELINETAAELLFSDLNYDFAVNDYPLIRGITRDIVNKDGRSVVSVENMFSSKSLGSALLQALQSGEGAFSLTGGTAIQFPEIVKKDPVPLRFMETGRFDVR
jgi:hypothetical protein